MLKRAAKKSRQDIEITSAYRIKKMYKCYREMFQIYSGSELIIILIYTNLMKDEKKSSARWRIDLEGCSVDFLLDPYLKLTLIRMSKNY